MNPRTQLILAAAMTLTLAGCAVPNHGRPADGAPGGASPMGRGGMMDQAQMCQQHQQMMGGKSASEQRSAIEAHVRAMHGNVSADMVQHHMKMMEMHCGPLRPN